MITRDCKNISVVCMGNTDAGTELSLMYEAARLKVKQDAHMCCNTKKSAEITLFISNIKHVLVSQWCQDLPFWVSLVEQIKVAIWKLSFVLSLVGVKLVRWCRFFPEGASFSSISIFVQGRVK